MDYCYACRRHLNGALACAGCGTPVEKLRYQTPHIPAHPPAPAPVHTQDPAYAEPRPAYAEAHLGYAEPRSAYAEPHLGYAEPRPTYAEARPAYAEPHFAHAESGGTYAEPDRAHAEPGSPYADPDRSGSSHESASEPSPEHVYELDVLEPPRPSAGGRRAARAAGQDRAAARGRTAVRRGRRSRSRGARTVLVSTVGLVLAAGTLSLARLALEDPPQDGAATAVEELDVTATPLAPEPLDDTQPPDGAGPSAVVDAPASTRPRQASAGSGTGGRRGSGSASGAGAGPASGTGSGQGPATGQGDGGVPAQQPTATGSPSAPTATPSSTAGGPTPTGSGTPGGPAPSATGSTPSGTPTPTPAPTQTCTRFLWWCV
ncbi:hypothetical protein [Streptomyces sp. NPDC056361]|uniref:SCO2400 family protein n=1 Tax=Streptomyces sp. NPDC056361 TaxID=3345795 RepID=UPI0035DBCD9E